MKSKGTWRAGYETVSNIRMFYRDWRPAGGEDSPPIIALHGSLSQSGMWYASAEALARTRFVCIDQRGFGRSADPGGGDAAADLARDAVELANALMIQRFIIMGHSFAGSIALQVAASEPERVAAAVLVDPTVRGPKGNRLNLEATRNRPEGFESLAEAAKFWRTSEEGIWLARHTDRFVRDIMEYEGEDGPCRMPFKKDRLLRLRIFQASEAGDYDPVRIAKRVKCPVLIFRGGQSRRLSAESVRKLRQALPKGAKALLCPKAGHFPPVSQPRLFQQGLGEFLAKVK